MKLKNILISQPQPSDLEKSPYRDLADKYNIKFDFHKFFKIEGIPAREFRQDRINILDYTAVIFTSRHAVDHFFRISKEMRVDIPETLKYFCISEAIALYLQKYVQYRKRKIFHGKLTSPNIMDIILKHKEEKFLFPCSDIHKLDVPDLLDKHSIKYSKAIIYKTVDDDLSFIDIKKYDVLILFSPSGVKSLLILEKFTLFEVPISRLISALLFFISCSVENKNKFWYAFLPTTGLLALLIPKTDGV